MVRSENENDEEIASENGKLKCVSAVECKNDTMQAKTFVTSTMINEMVSEEVQESEDYDERTVGYHMETVAKTTAHSAVPSIITTTRTSTTSKASTFIVTEEPKVSDEDEDEEIIVTTSKPLTTTEQGLLNTEITFSEVKLEVETEPQTFYPTLVQTSLSLKGAVTADMFDKLPEVEYGSTGIKEVDLESVISTTTEPIVVVDTEITTEFFGMPMILTAELTTETKEEELTEIPTMFLSSLVLEMDHDHLETLLTEPVTTPEITSMTSVITTEDEIELEELLGKSEVTLEMLPEVPELVSSLGSVDYLTSTSQIIPEILIVEVTTSEIPLTTSEVSTTVEKVDENEEFKELTTEMRTIEREETLILTIEAEHNPVTAEMISTSGILFSLNPITEEVESKTSTTTNKITEGSSTKTSKITGTTTVEKVGENDEIVELTTSIIKISGSSVEVADEKEINMKTLTTMIVNTGNLPESTSLETTKETAKVITEETAPEAITATKTESTITTTVEKIDENDEIVELTTAVYSLETEGSKIGISAEISTAGKVIVETTPQVAKTVESSTRTSASKRPLTTTKTTSPATTTVEKIDENDEVIELTTELYSIQTDKEVNVETTLQSTKTVENLGKMTGASTLTAPTTIEKVDENDEIIELTSKVQTLETKKKEAKTQTTEEITTENKVGIESTPQITRAESTTTENRIETTPTSKLTKATTNEKVDEDDEVVEFTKEVYTLETKGSETLISNALFEVTTQKINAAEEKTTVTSTRPVTTATTYKSTSTIATSTITVAPSMTTVATSTTTAVPPTTTQKSTTPITTAETAILSTTIAPSTTTVATSTSTTTPIPSTTTQKSTTPITAATTIASTTQLTSLSTSTTTSSTLSTTIPKTSSQETPKPSTSPKQPVYLHLPTLPINFKTTPGQIFANEELNPDVLGMTIESTSLDRSSTTVKVSHEASNATTLVVDNHHHEDLDIHHEDSGAATKDLPGTTTEVHLPHDDLHHHEDDVYFDDVQITTLTVEDFMDITERTTTEEVVEIDMMETNSGSNVTSGIDERSSGNEAMVEVERTETTAALSGITESGSTNMIGKLESKIGGFISKIYGKLTTSPWQENITNERTGSSSEESLTGTSTVFEDTEKPRLNIKDTLTNCRNIPNQVCSTDDLINDLILQITTKSQTRSVLYKQLELLTCQKCYDTSHGFFIADESRSIRSLTTRHRRSIGDPVTIKQQDVKRWWLESNYIDRWDRCFSFPGDTVEMTCGNVPGMVLKGNVQWMQLGATRGVTGKLMGKVKKGTKVTFGTIKPNGNLAIDRVTPQMDGNYTCVVQKPKQPTSKPSQQSKSKGKSRKNRKVKETTDDKMVVYNHELAVVRPPTLEFRVNLAYNYSGALRACGTVDLNVINRQYSKEVEPILCGKTHPVCSVTVKDAECHMDNDQITLTVVVTLTKFEDLLAALSTYDCDLDCRVKTYFKVVMILFEAIPETFSAPVFLDVSSKPLVKMYPQGSRTSLVLVPRCPQGFQLPSKRLLCVPCEKNHYNDGSSAKCRRCDLNSYTKSVASKSCTICEHFYQDLNCLTMFLDYLSTDVKFWLVVVLLMVLFVFLCCKCIRRRGRRTKKGYTKLDVKEAKRLGAKYHKKGKEFVKKHRNKIDLAMDALGVDVDDVTMKMDEVKDQYKKHRKVLERVKEGRLELGDEEADVDRDELEEMQRRKQSKRRKREENETYDQKVKYLDEKTSKHARENTKHREDDGEVEETPKPSKQTKKTPCKYLSKCITGKSGEKTKKKAANTQIQSTEDEPSDDQRLKSKHYDISTEVDDQEHEQKPKNKYKMKSLGKQAKNFYKKHKDLIDHGLEYVDVDLDDFKSSYKVGKDAYKVVKTLKPKNRSEKERKKGGGGRLVSELRSKFERIADEEEPLLIKARRTPSESDESEDCNDVPKRDVEPLKRRFLRARRAPTPPDSAELSSG